MIRKCLYTDHHVETNLKFRRSNMLGALAAVALVVGSISATVAVNQDDAQANSQTREPVVEVQSLETVETFAE
jgi:hypothetical protein